MIHFYAPDNDGSLGGADLDSSTSVGASIHDGVVLRRAFQDILEDPQKYQSAQRVPAWGIEDLESGIAELGILTNTFLVVDTTCIESVMPNCVDPLYEDMRILAFESTFPGPSRKPSDGYQGFSWVRVDQLVYHLYELRLMKAGETGIDDIWQAAQISRFNAFVSMRPDEALSRSYSSALRGYTPDSVIGKRWYASRDKRRER